ncbi:MAG: heparinase II/III family protein [Lachnospiraceae bacterium]|nr:heparinase II/III family protein [Lachnospiraceae bacterium]
MFRTWLNDHKLEDYDFSGTIFEKASNRAFWEPKRKEKFIQSAESFLGYEWPLIRATDYLAFFSEGDRVRQETPHFAKRYALTALVIGETLEYKGRFINDIIDGIFNICEETYWGLSAHQPPVRSGNPGEDPKPLLLPDPEDPYIDLFAAETGAALAIILHLLGDELEAVCPEIVKRIRNELDRRILKPYLSHTDYVWMGYVKRVNNWNPWILSNILTVVLLTPQPKHLICRVIGKAMFEIQAIYDRYPADGGCDEGMSYWGVSGGTIFEFLEQLYLATGGAIDFFSDAKIRKIGEYAYKTCIGNRYIVNFADGSARGFYGSASIYYRFGIRIGCRELTLRAKEDALPSGTDLHSIRNTYMKRTLWNVIHEDEINALDAFRPCEEAFFPDLENAVARSGQWFYAAKGGNNHEGHNHNDVGSFIAYHENRPVLIDPGCGVYRRETFNEGRYRIWTMRSEYHNLPVINGLGEHEGGEFKASFFGYSGKTAAIRFASAYETSSGIRELERRVSVRETGVTVQDKFDFSGDRNAIAEHFMTVLPVRIRRNAAILGERYELRSDETAEISVESIPFSGDEKLIQSWGTDAMERIIFRFETGKTKTITFTLRCLS